MTREIRITALPEEESHPDHVIAAIEASIARVNGAKLLEHWTDQVAGSGGAELAVRVAVRLETGAADGVLEQAIANDLRRRRLACAVCSARPATAGVLSGDDREHRVRDEVRHLVHLVPRGRVTTVDAIGAWIDTEADRVAATLEALGAASRGALPWHRVTAADGRLDTLRSGTRAQAQAARLEAEGVPVRYERVVGFRARFIDVVRLGTGDGRSIR